jgi:hypothetical protein
MNLDRGILCVHAELTLGLLFVAAAFLIAGCGGGSVASPVSSTPTPVTPTTANVQGQWQVIAQSTNGGTGVLIETNLAQSGSTVTAAKSSVVLIQGVPGTYTGLGGECDNGALGNDSIQATVSGQTLSFTMTEAGSLGTGTSTGTATISSDGTQITSGTYMIPAACGFQMDNGTLTGAVIKPFSGTFAGMLANGSTTDAVTVTISQSNYNLSVTGTDNGTPFTLSGTVVGATFNVTGTIAGQSVQYVGLYETSANDFRVYDTSFNPLGVLNPQSAAPPPTPISISVSPSTASVQVGNQANFTATVMNDSASKGVTWTASGLGCSGATCGTVSPNSSTSGAPVVYTAPAAIPSGTVTLTATSLSDSTKSASAAITITGGPAITVSVSPTMTSVATGGATASFTATLQNDAKNKGVNWTLSLSGATCTASICGAVSPATSLSGASVTYTSPASVPSGTLTLAATSIADSTKSASAAITVGGATKIAVTVTPATSNIATGGVAQTFTANVQNDSQTKGVAWTLSGANCTGATCGAVSPASTLSGAMVTYTSPASAATLGTVVLTATSVADSTVAAAASISLAAPPAPTPSAPLNLGEASVPEGFGIPVIATDAAGNVDVAWINQPGPEFVHSTNGGATFSAPLVIPSNMQDTADNNNIQMGVDGNGDINLIWHRELTPTGTVPNSFFSRSTDGGATFSSGVNPGGATSAQLIVHTDGKIAIVWFDQTTSNLLAVSSSDGVNFSGPTTVWTAVGNPMDLIVLSGPQGQIYLFWTQVVTMTNCSILFSSSGDGNTFTPAATVSTGAGSCNQTPSALVDSKGNVIVAWDADGAAVFFSHSTNSGASFSTPVSIPTTAKPLSPRLAVSTDGTIYIVWQTGSGESFARSVDGGATFSPAPPTFVLGQFAVVDSCNNVTVVGTGNQGRVMYQRSTDGGMTFAPPVTISDFTFNYELQITIDKSGNVHIVWGVDGPPEIEYVRIPTTCFVH